MSVSVTGVDFITVFVKDYPAAQEFYGGLLGLEHSVDYEKIPAGEYETGNLTLQVMDAASIGQEFKPRAPPDRPARRRRRGRPRRARSQGCRLLRRDDRQRRLPHGALRRPRRQRADVPQPLRAEALLAAMVEMRSLSFDQQLAALRERGVGGEPATAAALESAAAGGASSAPCSPGRGSCCRWPTPPRGSSDEGRPVVLGQLLEPQGSWCRSSRSRRWRFPTLPPTWRSTSTSARRAATSAPRTP